MMTSTMVTVDLLHEFALFRKCNKDFLGCRLWDGAFEIGSDINGTIWAVHL